MPLPCLHFCLIGETAIFLDLAGDRFFRLREESNATFVQHLRQEVAASDALCAAGLARFADTAALAATRCDPPVRHSPAICESGFSPLGVVRVLWAQTRCEHELRKYGLQTVLDDLHDRLSASHLMQSVSDDRARAIVRAFEHSRLIRNAADRCLPRSIALARMLIHAGFRCNLVLGVKIGPFAAHCWVRAGNVVLNETAEEAARFTPVIVV